MKKLFLVVVLMTVAVSAQTVYTPSVSQHKAMMSEREALVKIQNQISRLQSEASFRAGRMKDLCRQISLENRWPADVVCDLNALMFYQAAPHPSTVPLSVQQETKAPDVKEEKKP